MSLKSLHSQNAFFLSDPVLELVWYIHRLLLCNQFPLSSAAYHSSFWGLRILARLSWGFWLRASQEAVVKLLARTTVWRLDWGGKIHFQAHSRGRWQGALTLTSPWAFSKWVIMRERRVGERGRERETETDWERGGRSLYVEMPFRSSVPLLPVSVGLTDQGCDGVSGDDTGYENQDAGLRADHLRGCLPPMGRWGRE